jgi:GAF domain-containing protein
MGFLHPDREAARLEALRQYELMDTEAEKVFDDIVVAAATICGTPTAMISLLDEQRQWFKARVGIDVSETPRSMAFCDVAIRDPSRTLIVENATLDPRFAENPLVTGGPLIRYYMGTPLQNDAGVALGTLCVIDTKPQQPTEQQVNALEALQRVAMHAMEQRKVTRTLARTLENVKELSGLLPICSHCKSIRNDKGYWDTLSEYLSRNTDVNLTHGICPDCLAQHYPDYTPHRHANQATD